MRKAILCCLILVPALSAGCAPQGAVDAPTTVKTDGTRVVRPVAGALTPPSTEAPPAIAIDYLVAGGRVASPDQLVETATVPGKRGVTHVRMAQTVDGLRVHNAYAKIAVSARGEVLHAVDRLAFTRGGVARARISERQALAAAMAELGYSVLPEEESRAGNRADFGVTEELYRGPTVERVVYLEGGGAVHPGFLVETWSRAGNRLDHSLIDGEGAVVSVEHRTSRDRYSVFVEDPLKGEQTVMNGPGAGNTESPAGWLGSGAQNTLHISGNNTSTYLDADASNTPDSGGASVTGGDFLAQVDLTLAPSGADNRAVAVQNLFYLNNVVHDVLYRHGFTEAAGNFQVDNFGSGGAGNDPVKAEAQDGSGMDNANMATPLDGSSPRMQMYLWSGAGPDTLVTVNGADHGAYRSTFGPAPTLAGAAGALAVYADGSSPATDGCEASVASLAGKVAIVDRGTCNFTVKVLNAQKAGAVAVVIVNSADAGAFGPGGSDRRVKIPSCMVTKQDGQALKALAGATATVRKNPVTPLPIDADLDSDIVFHEYGHGLTWRMIGAMSGKLAGAVGEGASDTVAFLINGDDRVGEYSASRAEGIRNFPYSSYPLTYGDVTGAGVHADGEIYAGAMWRLREEYLAAGNSIEIVLGDFVDGMNFTPAAPAFEDMRDGMLQSAAGTGRECLIWRAFAASGIGVGADGQVHPSGKLSITESFAVPPECL